MIKPTIILKAWAKVLEGETTDEHKRRAEICKQCPKAKYKKYLDFTDNGLENVKGYICGVCKCPLVALIRSEDKCNLNKW